jgi:hypothetical protein
LFDALWHVDGFDGRLQMALLRAVQVWQSRLQPQQTNKQTNRQTTEGLWLERVLYYRCVGILLVNISYLIPSELFFWSTTGHESTGRANENSNRPPEHAKIFRPKTWFCANRSN